MKIFLMRGVVLVTLLSFLVLPASAAFSNTDSTNISNIKTYTFDIKTALTSGTLYKNVSSIETSVKNISSTVSSIYTQIQASNNHLSTGNSNTSAIKDRIGSITNSGYRSIAEAMLTLGGKLDSSISKLTETSNKITTFDNNVWGKLTTIAVNTSGGSGGSGVPDSLLNNVSIIVSNTSLISKSNEWLSSITGNTYYSYDKLVSLDSSTSDILSKVTSISSIVSKESKQDTMIHYLSNLSDTLASDEDKAIRESQNGNVSVVKDQFVYGSSNVGGEGSTGRSSLGKGDFEALGGFGSTGRGGFGLNGQASVDSFNTGLDDANTSGLGWFSADTKNALDSVSASAGKRSPARDSDPYNMSGFFDNYNWVFGGD